MSGGGTRPPVLVLVMGVAFALIVVSLLIGSLTRPEFPAFTLTEPHPGPVGDSIVGPATYTLDASATDRWRRFDFDRNAAVDSGPWDISFRRFHLIVAPGGGIADLGAVPFDSVREVPAGGYASNSEGADTTNPSVGKWYAYSMLRSQFVLLTEALILLTTVVLYVLACDPLPPCRSKVRAWVRAVSWARGS